MTRICIITGAGASVEYGLPTGAQLIQRIRQKMLLELSMFPRGRLVDTAIKMGAEGDLRIACQSIASGMLTARSIDRFLDLRKDEPAVTALGKVAIADCILDSERMSQIFRFSSDDYSIRHEAINNVHSSWLARIFSTRAADVLPKNAKSILDGISFITFNYDRVIEEYLPCALMQIADVESNLATEIASKVPIFHVYGSMGSPLNVDEPVPFGSSPSLLQRAASSLRIFTEGVESGAHKKIQEKIAESETIIITGFYFDAINIKNVFGGLDLKKNFVISKYGEIDYRGLDDLLRT